jgi:dUTP pyrophosphatase
MKLKIKKLIEDVSLPIYAREGDAGMDLEATSMSNNGHYIEYGTGLALEIPEGYAGFLFPRSSISNTGHQLLNSVGVIDSGYRGEVKIRLSYTTFNTYKVGDKVAQLIILKLPFVDIEEVDELDVSERNEGGFGSTDQSPIRVWRRK